MSATTMSATTMSAATPAQPDNPSRPATWLTAQHATEILAAARRLGFCHAGFAPLDACTRGAKALRAWLARGYHADMTYMAAHGDRDDLTRVLPAARSALVVALAYADGSDRTHEHATAPDDGATLWRGSVARYARGADYHHVMRGGLAQLQQAVEAIVQRPVLARGCVDTAPILEHELAARAGIGFIGKSTLTIAPGIGSFVVLGELLLDLALPPSPPPAKSRCGDCTACLTACPTGAFVAPYVLDARRCIAYLTIELRDPIPHAVRPLIGARVFGCDACQTSCPFNASTQPRPLAPALRARPALQAPSLVEWLTLTSGQYKRLTVGTALSRCSRQQLARNAAVALGNVGDARAVPALSAAAQHHRHALVRGHAAWALGRIGGPAAVRALLAAADGETDPAVRDEIDAALAAAHLPVASTKIGRA